MMIDDRMGIGFEGMRHGNMISKPDRRRHDQVSPGELDRLIAINVYLKDRRPVVCAPLRLAGDDDALPYGSCLFPRS